MRRPISPFMTAVLSFSAAFAPAVTVAAPSVLAADGAWCATLSSYANYTAKLSGQTVGTGKVRNYEQVCWHNNIFGSGWDSRQTPQYTEVAKTGYRSFLGRGWHTLTIVDWPHTDTAYIDWKVGGSVGALTCRSKMVHEHYTHPTTSATIYWDPYVRDKGGIDGYAGCSLTLSWSSS